MGATDRKNLYHAIKAAVLLLLLVVLGILVLRETPPELFDPKWIEELLHRRYSAADLAGAPSGDIAVRDPGLDQTKEPMGMV